MPDEQQTVRNVMVLNSQCVFVRWNRSVMYPDDLHQPRVT